MKIIKLEQAEKSNNSEKCKVLEYSFNDKDIDCATAVISDNLDKVLEYLYS